MKKYMFLIYVYIKKRTAYKFDIIVGYVFALVIAFTYKYFWASLAMHGKIPQGELSDYISYSALTTIMSLILGGEMIGSFGDKIRDGSVVSDLQKPLSFQVYTMVSGFGSLAGNILFNMLPRFIAIYLAIGIYTPTKPLSVLLFAASFFLGCLIALSIDYILSIFAIYFVEVISLIILKGVVIGLFAGAIIPLWIFPQWLLDIINLLPFRLMCFSPASIYLEKVSYIDAMNLLLLQVFWIVALTVVGKVISHICLKRITVAGG
ncbi:MAG TPA: ABC-2 family transporter protein [Clostridia bacterium]|nr:ABC-2 family transporter protein [Clostridia bacterium]